MRSYDKITGKRFDKLHPVWQSHFLTKAGKPREKFDWKHARALEQEGLIDLRPSVTSVCDVANGFGSFSAGSRWAMYEADKLYTELRNTSTVMPADFKARLNQVMTRTRDYGTYLHDAFDEWASGNRDTFKPDQRRMIDLCHGYITDNFPGEHITTEKQFCGEEYGGTIDVLVQFMAVLDWKTVGKPREIKPSERVQAVAYAKHIGVEEAHIVQINQYDLTISNREVIKGDEFKHWEQVMEACFALFYLIDNNWKGHRA